MRFITFVLPALVASCHAAALPRMVEAREPQIIETITRGGGDPIIIGVTSEYSAPPIETQLPGITMREAQPQVLGPDPTRTVIVSPTPLSWPPWPPFSWPPKPSHKPTLTTQEPTTWLTYTYPAPQPTRTTPVLTVPIDKRDPQILGWPSRTVIIAPTNGNPVPESTAEGTTSTIITEPPYTPIPTSETDAGTTTCVTDPYPTPDPEPTGSRSTSYGGADTTRTIPVITVPISDSPGYPDSPPVLTLPIEERDRTIIWGNPGITRTLPPIEVPITARNAEYTRSVIWGNPGETRSVPVFTVPLDKRQTLGPDPTRTVIIGPTPDPPLPTTTSKTLSTKPTTKPTTSISTSKTTSKPTSITSTNKPTTTLTLKTTTKPHHTTKPHPPWPTRSYEPEYPDSEDEDEEDTIEARQVLGYPGHTVVWPTAIPRPTDLPVLTIPAKRQEFPSGGYPTRTAITWWPYPPRPTVWPPIEVPPVDVVEREVEGQEQVRRRFQGAERRRQEMGSPTRTIILGG